MNYEDIRKVRLQHPFRPFILRMKNGEEYLIPDPVNLAISNRILAFVDPKTGLHEHTSPEAAESVRFIDENLPTEPRSVDKDATSH